MYIHTCLMSSHLHLIVSASEGFKLSEIIRDFKKHTAKKIIEQSHEKLVVVMKKK
jgi:putative transposase